MTKQEAKTTDGLPEKAVNVYQAIAKVQAALAKEGISKDRTTGKDGESGPKFKFRGIDDVYNTISGLLADTGLCILPRLISRETSERKKPDGKMLYFVAVEVEYDLVSAHDGSKHTVRVPGEAMDSGDKATNKAMSAAYKYACLQTFCIPTEGDNDADASTHEVAAPVGVFQSLNELNAFVANCLDALAKAATIEQVKDQRDLNAARISAMRNSPVAADRDGYQKIISAQNALVEKLKAKRATVDAAKQTASMPASVADDEIPF